MDIIELWSERIAQRVTPDEIDFAAAVGAAYAEGGRARKNLFARKGVQPGAFGPGTLAADLPIILHALAGTGAAILALLRAPYVSDALAASALLQIARHHRGHGSASRAAEPAATSGGAEDARADQVPASELRALGQAHGQLSDRLRAAGFAQERSDQLAYELLAELLTEATSAASFIDVLTAAPAGGRRQGSDPGSLRSRPRESWPRPKIKGP